MIAPAKDVKQPQVNEFATHMEALEQLRRELEGGDLDPVEALERCRRAEEHYRAVDAILSYVEMEIEGMQEPDVGTAGRE